MASHYSKAPIAEAVIDIHVGTAAEIDVPAVFQNITGLEHFPKRLPIAGIRMGFVGEAAASPKFIHEQLPVGMRFETQNGDRVLQLQQRSFTFSHLAPYTSWQQFRAEATKLWLLYLEAAAVTSVCRLAVRVINKLKLPVPLSELGAYSKVLPHMPESVPFTADKFFMQFQLPLANVAEGCRAIINVASSEDGARNCSELLLDFDLYVEQEMKPDASAVFLVLDKLSEGKNQLFEACISDRTRQLIK